jgi:hypothetical protein
MSKNKIMIYILIFILIALCVFGVFFYIKNKRGANDNAIYKIDGKEVNKVYFRLFLKTLIGQENWSCNITRGGGETHYQSKNILGQKYEVVLKTDKQQNVNSITKIK